MRRRDAGAAAVALPSFARCELSRLRLGLGLADFAATVTSFFFLFTYAIYMIFDR